MMPGVCTNCEAKDVEGVASVGHDTKSLTADWQKQRVKTAISAETCIQRCVENLENMCSEVFSFHKTPMLDTEHPELDDSPLLSPTDHAKFRSSVGCANWLVTLGRFNIACATNALS